MPHATSESEYESEIKRKPLGQHGQYTVTEIQELDGIHTSFDVYDLIIREHTALIVGEEENSDGLEALTLAFNSPVAVDDLGVEVLRASHIVIPLEGVRVLEEVTGRSYTDTRWVENPLNHSPPCREEPLTYPSDPALASDHSNTEEDTGIATLR